MTAAHTLESLTDDLRGLGIVHGDILMMGADLGHVGLIRGNVQQTLMQALRNVVGPTGTLVTVAFTPAYFLRSLRADQVFDRDSPSDSGGLSRLLLRQPDALRSQHPVCSFVAVGPAAHALLDGHDETSLSYEPIGRIIDAGGKMFLIGCADERNGIQAIHYAQERLGLTSRSLLRGRTGVYYRKDGETRRFVRQDIGGCSRGFYKFYAPFITRGGMRAGYVGDAHSVIIDARRAYDIVAEILRDDPRALLCDDPDCFSCRGSWTFNKRDMPAYYARNLLRLLPKIRRAWSGARQP